MTKYVVSGYIGFDNFGDEAIAQTLVSILKSKGAEKITLISSNPTKTSAEYGVDSCGMLDFIKPIMETDVLISGGGSLLQDITSLKSLIYYLAIIMFALVMNKKVVIFAQGFSSFRTKIGEFLTSFVLKRCHKISVRDAESQEVLNKLGVSSELVADPIFGVEVPLKKIHRGVGVQLRGYKTLTNEFLESLADIIAERFKGESIKLFSFQDSIDYKILLSFSEKLKDRGLESKICNNLSVKEAIEELSSLEYLIGMRFHALLVAVKCGVKTLAINYDAKVLSLAKFVGCPVVELNQFGFENEFDKLFLLKPENYNIPEFKSPDLG